MLVCIPRITIKEVALTATSFSHTPSSTNRIISAILHIYRRFLHLYQRFFIISTVRHRLSTYRQFSATYLCSIPCHYNKKKLPNGNFFSTYPTSYSLKYINDFSNISIISPLISTIFSLYQRFNTRYRFNDNLRHSKRTTYPIPKQLTAELYD